MEKKPFVTKEQLEEIAKTYPTPFYLYDEKGIRENALKLKEAFSWNKGILCGKSDTEPVYFKNTSGAWMRNRLLFQDRAFNV